MPKLRHELNILNTPIIGANFSSEQIWFDPTKYSGTLTPYFEIVASITSGSATVTLLDSSHSLSWVCTVTDTTPTLYRTQMTGFYASASTEYQIQCNGANITVKAGRIVVYQDTGNDVLWKCESQIEIGSRSSVLATSIPTGTSVSNQTNPKYFFYDSTKWNGNITAYFEAMITTPASKTAANCQLQVADGTGDGFAGWANVPNGVVSYASTTFPEPVRSPAITLTSGRWYRIMSSSPSSKSAMVVYGARIIIQQSVTTSNYITQSTSGSLINLTGPGTTNAIIAQTFIAPFPAIVLTAVALSTTFVNNPVDQMVVEITSSLGGAVLATSNPMAMGQDGLVFSFPVALALTANATYVIQVRRTGSASTLNYWQFKASPSSAYASGQVSVFDDTGGGWISQPSNDLTFTVTGALATAIITKLQPRYLILNTLAATGTALQKQLMSWDSTDWASVSNTYKLEVNAANGSTSAVQLRTADDATLVATVTSPDNAGSGAATMP